MTGKKPSLGFIGAGTVGTALAVRLSQKGYPVVAAASRSPASAERLAKMVSGCAVAGSCQGVADAAEIVFITTPDAAIPLVAGSLKWRRGQGVVHCSGADSVDVLEAPRSQGAKVGVFHPLQTLASVAEALENIPGSTFGLEGEGPLLGHLMEMVAALGGRWVLLGPGDKVLYHAAAVFACNYLVTLTSIAAELWEAFGSSKEEAVKALLPLLRGTVNNIERVGLPHCLTGPIARGDTGTIRKHLKALQEKAPHFLSLYKELGGHTIPIALAKGRLSPERAEELKGILVEAETTARREK